MRPRQFASSKVVWAALDQAGIPREEYRVWPAVVTIGDGPVYRGPAHVIPVALELWAEDPDRVIEVLEASGLYVDGGEDAMTIWVEPAQI